MEISLLPSCCKQMCNASKPNTWQMRCILCATSIFALLLYLSHLGSNLHIDEAKPKYVHLQNLSRHHEDALTFGRGMHAFSMPIHLDGCLNAVLYGHAKCMTYNTTHIHYRIILAWYNTVESPPSGNADMYRFGPGDCELPPFWLQSGRHGHRFPLQVLIKGGLDPTLMEAVVSADDEYSLLVNQYSWTFASDCVTRQAPVMPSFPKRNYALLSVRPVFNSVVNYAQYTRILSAFCAHHVALGLTGVIAYYEAFQLHRLKQLEAFNILVSTGVLTPVVWEFTPRIRGGGAHVWGAQAFAISHGFLSTWEQDCGLLAIDLDEWLHIGHEATGGNMKSAWETCWQKNMCVELPRLTSFCNGCEDDQSRVWSHPEPFFHFNLVAATSGHQPVEYVKPWAAAWIVNASSIHHVFGCQPIASNISCAGLMHLVNLWEPRFQPNMSDAYLFDRRSSALIPWTK